MFPGDTPNKLIFLDMDGVLNSMRTVIAHPKESRTHLNIDPIAVLILKRLQNETGAGIVLSSTWRLHYELEAIQNILKQYGFPDAPVYWRTPTCNSGFRGEEVAMFLEKYEEDHQLLIQSYVILDDSDDFYHRYKELTDRQKELRDQSSIRYRQSQPFVQCSDSFGLGTSQYRVAKYILNTLSVQPSGDKKIKKDIDDIIRWEEGIEHLYRPELPPVKPNVIPDVKLRY